MRRWLTLLVLAAVLVAAAWTAFQLVTGIQYERDTESLRGADLAVSQTPDSGITNLALFGVDADNDGTRRSDCIMVLSIDGGRGKVKITSLMRDSRVEIDGHGESKLNHSYSYGGPALAIRTINQNFDLNIEHFVQVDFSQMANLIGAIGGVEIDVKENEIRELNKFIGEYCRAAGAPECPVEQPGLQMLNGIQAMSYGRIRKGGTGDDWARVERQSIVMEAMFSKVQSMSASELIGLMQKLMPYVTTSLSATEIAPLIVGALQNGMPEIEHTRVPLDGEWDYYGASSEYILYDVDVAADHIHEYIYNDVYPGETPSDTGSTGATDGDTSSTGANEPLGGIDFDEPPTGPMTTDDSASSSGSTDDPASLAEEGGWYDPDTGDYYDSDGDRYYLDESGTRVYYAE